MPTEKPRLSRVVQLRMTEEQYAVLEMVAAESDRPVSAIARDVITVWSLQHDAMGEVVDVEAMVAELQSLEEEA